MCVLISVTFAARAVFDAQVPDEWHGEVVVQVQEADLAVLLAQHEKHLPHTHHM